MLATYRDDMPWVPDRARPGAGGLVAGLLSAGAALGVRIRAVAHQMAEAAADRASALGKSRERGGAARFDALILPHLDAAYNLARYLSRDADAAQDIVQDAVLRAWRSFADFRGASPRAWLLAIVRNCHATWRLKHRRTAHAVPLPQEDGEAPDEAAALLTDADTPESLLLRRSEADAVRALLEHLPEPLREALVLRELDELSYREIAEVTGVPVGTVMSRLSRARRLFADLWSRTPAGADAGAEAAP